MEKSPKKCPLREKVIDEILQKEKENDRTPKVEFEPTGKLVFNTGTSTIKIKKASERTE